MDYYVARAKGGIGMMITGVMRPSLKLEPALSEPVINSPKSAHWLSVLADAVHANNAKICVQLTGGFGRIASPNTALPHGGVVCASAVPCFQDP